MPRLSKIGAAALAAFGWTSGSSVSVNYLVVAGGGGGGGCSGSQGAQGGGGAGGLRSTVTNTGGGGSLESVLSLSLLQSYTVTVGAGGAAGIAATIPGNGGNSVFSTITSTGGGAGGSPNFDGQNGGSGGGGSYQEVDAGTGTSGQGFAGGPNTVGTGGGSFPGGGGGGAGAVGANGDNSVGRGNGGAGVTNSISGSSVTYAGGGGGGANGTAGVGGAGGGGAGGNNVAGTNGTANLGGGGGGCGNSGGALNGGNGGSGIVIISYLGAQQFGGGVVTVSGGNTIHTFTTSGTLSPLNSLTANFLVVAGGGGGGYNFHTVSTGGGGGAGGYRTSSGLTIDTNSTYLVTVGAGGAGAPNTSTNGGAGTDSFFSTITSTGGGYGATNQQVGGNGGSGGGASGPTTPGSFAGGLGNTPSTSPVQGFDGGSATQFGGGGGGGSSAAGQIASLGGAGGAGTANSISGAAVTYATGGGSNNAGGANVGDGGGRGTGGANNPGFAGGSGVVIISYPGATQQMAGGTVTIAGGNVIHTFTNSGYLAPIITVNNSLRFRSSASANLSRTFTSNGSSYAFTQSIWCKRGTLGAYQAIGYSFLSSGSVYSAVIRFNTNDTLDCYVYYDGSSWTAQLSTTQVFRDPAAWYHIVLAVDTAQATSSNRLKLYVNGSQVTAFSTANYPSQNTVIAWNSNGNVNYQINSQNSVYYFDGYTTELNYIDGQQLTPNSFGTSNSLGSWQPIRYGGSYGTNGFYLPFTANALATVQYVSNAASNYSNFGGTAWQFTGAFTIETYVNYQSASSGDNSVYIVSNGTTYLGFNIDKSANLINVYLNGSSPAFTAPYTVSANTWAHLALVRSGSTVTMYVNGVVKGSTTSAGTLGYASPTINRNGGGASAARGMSNLRICTSAVYTSNFTPSTTALTTTSQGATNCILLTLQSNPPVDASTNAYSVTTTGTLLYATAYPFAWNIFNDQGPAGNNWTPNNISGYPDSTLDYMTDVPTLTSATVANYATINPLDYNSTYLTLDNGNLQQTYGGLSAAAASRATMTLPTTGKFYWEVTLTTIGTNNTTIRAGICSPTTAISGNSIDNDATSYLQITDGQKRNSATASTYGAGFSNGQILQVLYDATAGAIYFGQNNSFANGSGNFNQTFSTATAAFTGLSGEFMPCFITYAGSDIAVNFGQRPFTYTPPTGFVRLNTFNFSTPTVTQSNKNFDVTTFTGNASTNVIVNSGFMQPDMVWLKSRTNANNHTLFDSVRGVNNLLYPNLTNEAATGTAQLTSFNSNGFTLGASENSNDSSGELSVGWQWKESVAAGFDILTYTGDGGTGASSQYVNHNLGVTPNMIITKVRSSGATYPSWYVYLSAVQSGNFAYYGILNSSNPWSTGSSPYQLWTANATQIAFNTTANESGKDYVAYCFAEVAGYSKFGSYTGTGAGDSNGPFIYCGFRPALIIIKVDTAGYNWAMMDIERPGYNSISYRIFADVPNDETTVGDPQLDFLSNGFKLKAGNANYAGTVYFMAFAENPFKYANAR